MMLWRAGKRRGGGTQVRATGPLLELSSRDRRAARAVSQACAALIEKRLTTTGAFNFEEVCSALSDACSAWTSASTVPNVLAKASEDASPAGRDAPRAGRAGEPMAAAASVAAAANGAATNEHTVADKYLLPRRMVPDEERPDVIAPLPHWVHPRRRSDPFGGDILEWPRPASAAEAEKFTCQFSCAACRARLKDEELEEFFKSSAWISWREASEPAKVHAQAERATPRPEAAEQDERRALGVQVAETAVRVVPTLLELVPYAAALAPEGVAMCVGCARQAMQDAPS